MIGKFALPANNPSGGGGTLTQTLRQYVAGTTWNKPSGLVFIEVLCLGAGGGGGSGGQFGSTIAAPGGGGGGAPSISWTQIMAASLGATETVTIGAGGTGGTPQLTASTVGNNGGTGGDTSFGAHCVAKGGLGATNRNGGGQRQIQSNTPAYGWGSFPGHEGRNASAAGGQGSAGDPQSLATNFGAQVVNVLGGCSGGGNTTANAIGTGNQGNQYYLLNGTTTTRIQGGGAAGANGLNGTDNAVDRMVWPPRIAALSPSYKLGVSGGSGASSITGTGGNGGNGGLYGGSGSGGGGSRNGNASGAGGSGAGGLCFVIEYTI
jgi:hypothetical protein